MKKEMVYSMIVGVICGVVGFGGGYTVGKKTVPAGGPGQFAGMRNGTGQNGQPRMFAKGNNLITGEVVSVDATSLTVKLRDGSSKVILMSEKTSVGKAVEGKKEDIIKGAQVMVGGESNSDGSLTATSVQIRPQTELEKPVENK